MAPPTDDQASPGSGRHHERALAALARRGRLRRLAPRSGIDFTSNDYLGLAQSPELAAAARSALDRGVPLGAGGSRLLRGNHEEHQALEEEAAHFFGSEAALYFGGGFTANAALIATLPARGDLVVHDSLIHASAWDGMAQTKAETVSAAHNDPQSFADVIGRWRGGGGAGRVWIAVESLYSMDGDAAPLADLAAIADRHDAMLLIDEAHATGVLGPGGRGLGASLEGRENVIALHTCGKALGASGALITGPASIRDFLVNRARAFIYATAPSPVMAAVVQASLALAGGASGDARRAALAGRIALARVTLSRTCGAAGSGSHVLPVIVGSDGNATALATAMQGHGYDIRAIRPPTVPEGTARLRITLTLNTSEADVTAMLETLGAEMRARGIDSVAAAATNRNKSLPSQTLACSPPPCGEGLGEADIAIPAAVADPHPRPLLTRGRGAEGPLRTSVVAAGKRPPRYVVTGTGTGIGKTVFAAALSAALDGDYWKPVQAGLDGPTDTQRVRALTGLPDDRLHPEAYRLATPVSPHHAARIDGVAIEPAALTPPDTARALVIEGAGGLMVPLTDNTLIIDLFARWQIPVILVASTALGTINHSLLSIEALRARAIPLHGIAFIGEEIASSQAIICAKGRIRQLGRLPWLREVSQASLQAAFAAHFDVADFAPVAPEVTP